MKTIKKEIFLILLLLLLILLPPLLRTFLPKEKYPNKINTKINKTLTCETTTKDHYKITYQTTYQDQEVEKIMITFEDQDENRNPQEITTTTDQMDYFCSMKESTYEYLNNNLTVTLTKKVYQKRKTEEPIKSMYQPYDSLKKYYQKLGYTCKE